MIMVMKMVCGMGGGPGKSAVSGQKSTKSYGMELPRVGAFTEKWGSGYRNPVHFLGVFPKNHVKSRNSGLV